VKLSASRHMALEIMPGAPSATMNAMARGGAARWFG
jgi:hypothetical protein